MYKADPNDNTKQVPTGGEDFGRQAIQSTTPPAKIIQYRPDSIIINHTGSYCFQYQTTGSVGGNPLDGEIGKYVTGSNLISIEQGPISLPIQPIAWYRQGSTAGNMTIGNVGDVTFIYRGRPE